MHKIQSKPRPRAYWPLGILQELCCGEIAVPWSSALGWGQYWPPPLYCPLLDSAKIRSRPRWLPVGRWPRNLNFRTNCYDLYLQKKCIICHFITSAFLLALKCLSIRNSRNILSFMLRRHKREYSFPLFFFSQE